MGLIIKPKKLQIRAMVGGKWQTVELVKCNPKTCVVKLKNSDIIKVSKFRIGGM